MRIVLPLLFMLVADAALAHPSVLPHDHPHGILPSFDAALIVALLAALAFIVFDFVRGRR